VSVSSKRRPAARNREREAGAAHHVRTPQKDPKEKFRLRGCSLWLPVDVRPCSRICIATPHAQVTNRARNSFAIDLKAESQPTLSRTDERLEKRNRSTLARQARAIRDIIAGD